MNKWLSIIVVILLLLSRFGNYKLSEKNAELQKEITILKNNSNDKNAEFQKNIFDLTSQINMKVKTINNLKKENSNLKYILKKYNITYKVDNKKYKSNSLFNKVFNEN